MFAILNQGATFVGLSLAAWFSNAIAWSRRPLANSLSAWPINGSMLGCPSAPTLAVVAQPDNRLRLNAAIAKRRRWLMLARPAVMLLVPINYSLSIIALRYSPKAHTSTLEPRIVFQST
ncbi:hypothetical protein EKL02_10520 [Janthinobacterium sp. 17J80-10]|nr:hypothetical protein EKL02_10520 [Janthinobacterium sp. 17J80-10]